MLDKKIIKLSKVPHRNHISWEKIDDESLENHDQGISFKPVGFWYAIDHYWLKGEVHGDYDRFEKLKKNETKNIGERYLYKVNIDIDDFTTIDIKDKRKILQLKTGKDIETFFSRYGYLEASEVDNSDYIGVSYILQDKLKDGKMVKIKVVDPKRIITTYKLTNEYIFWDKVSKDYAGIELSNVSIFKKLNAVEYTFINKETTLAYYKWYIGWDVPSACIWNIKNLSLSLDLIL